MDRFDTPSFTNYVQAVSPVLMRNTAYFIILLGGVVQRHFHCHLSTVIWVRVHTGYEQPEGIYITVIRVKVHTGYEQPEGYTYIIVIRVRVHTRYEQPEGYISQ